MQRGIIATKKFKKELQRMNKIIQRNAWEIILLLRENVFPDAQDIKKIKGYNNIWRARLGHYRLFYSFTEKDLILLRIAHRKDAYRGTLEEY